MSELLIDKKDYSSDFGVKNKIARIIWNCCYIILFRPFFFPFFRKWRNMILRAFGAKIAYTAVVYASARIWAPWNLELGERACIGPEVDCYNQGKITIGASAAVSQKSYLCASTHDISDPTHALVLAPIIIEDQAWVAADAFIGPGVTIGQGAVVGARAAVFKDVEPWTVVGGNPAKFIKKREIQPTNTPQQ